MTELEEEGSVEKSRQRRSLPSPKRFAQAGRHFAVLTYGMYAPRAKMAAAFPSNDSGQDWTDFFDPTRGL
jgi:hypothetical protein